jgi:pimeloyl-ACP methyl ester carboxylesterase
MSKIDIDGVRLHVEQQGTGDPIVLVHGSWDDARAWQLVAPLLAETHRVITYDRRGHTRSEGLDAVLTRRRHEDDLAAIIERLAGGRAHVVGNSYGGLITLGLAARRS